jgi:protein O-GlcNAc transferase
MASPHNLDVIRGQLIACYRAGDLGRAEQLADQLLHLERRDASAWHLRALIKHRQGNAREAVQAIDAALAIDASNPEYHGHRAEILRAAGRLEEAVAAARTATQLKPDHPPAWNNLGLALQGLEETSEAESAFRRALQLQPDYAKAHHNLGGLLRKLDRLEEAHASVSAALSVQPNYPEALNTLGVILQEQFRHDEAHRAFHSALQLRPQFDKALLNLGNLLSETDQLDEAQHVYRQALAISPNYAEALIGLAVTSRKQGRMADAINVLQKALQVQADSHEAMLNLASCFAEVERYEQACDVFDQILKLQPNCAEAVAGLAHGRAEMCDWTDRAGLFERIRELIATRRAEGKRCPIGPASVQAFSFSGAEKMAISQQETEQLLRRLGDTPQPATFSHPSDPGVRLRIGYFSQDFRHHATGHLIRALFGLHDRARYEIFAYSYGPDDGSVYRQQIAADCDHFIDVEHQSDTAIAARVRADKINIFIDLMGYAGKARPKVMALRPAPIQVSYLGYPGTMAAPFVDYFITDPVVTPPGQEPYFSERLVFMPHSYQVNDHHQPIGDTKPTRCSCGLPDDGFVYCAFNKNFKIEPVVFDVWMNVLKQVPKSVLWLTSTAAGTARNLRREAQSRDVAPERLIFAPIVSKPEHLARHGLADFYLDTMVCNGHTAASDALWAGLPVLTCPGETFAARVAASLLTAVGLAELIMPDAATYQSRAIELGQDPDDAQQWRTRLAERRTMYPLFDTPRFVRNFEKALHEMWTIHGDGEAPRRIVVEDPQPPQRGG